MAKTWLGFWDLGQIIGATTGNGTQDGALFSLLAFGVSRSAPFKAWRLTLPPATQIAMAQMNFADSIAFVHQYLKYKSWSNAMDSTKVHPTHLGIAGDSTITAMQRAIYLDEPDTPLAARLRTPTGYSFGISSIEGEANVHSPWIGVAPGAGPRYSMHFWDVSDDVGPTGKNSPGDVALVKWLMEQMLSGAEFQAVKGRTHLDRLSLNEWIVRAAPRCKELGWPITNPRVVAPTGGNIAAASMIRPLNYYAFRNSGKYLHLANRDLSPNTALWTAVRENVESLYFKTAA